MCQEKEKKKTNHPTKRQKSPTRLELQNKASCVPDKNQNLLCTTNDHKIPTALGS